MKAKTKQIVFPVVAIFLFTAFAAALLALEAPPEKKKSETPVPFVATEVIKMSPYTFEVRSQGVTEPRYQTELVAQVGGSVVEVADVFVRGGIVNKGDLLARIDPFDYEVKLQQAKSSLASARAAFILERAQGQVAEAEWKNITNAEPSELGLRKPQQEQALASVKAAEASLQQAQKDLERTAVRAPFDAIVKARSVSPGQFVNVGSVIGSVMDISVAEVRLPINKNDFRFIENQGLDALVILSAQLEGQTVQWQARIARDEGVVDEATRMVYLVATLPDPYGTVSKQAARLPFGTYVQAAITGKQLLNAARIPRSAIRDGKVATVVDNKLVFQAVTVARYEGRYSVVSSGLNSGDRLITSALDHPTEGMNVKFEEPSAQISAIHQGASN